MRRKFWFFLLLLLGSFVACKPATQQDRAAVDGKKELKLWHAAVSSQGESAVAELGPQLTVDPGDLTEAAEYYEKIRPNLDGFPQPTLTNSSISDMLNYYGFPALPPLSLEDLSPAVIMDFEQLRKVISTPEFDAAYGDRPLHAGDILVVRFFAPKIINVRDQQVDGVPRGGFGWRKVLRFRAREGSLAKVAGLDYFYLLFNYSSGDDLTFPEKVHAAQIQAILVPTYPTAGKHRDAYFLVYESLGSSAPGKVGYYLLATFDLAGVVSDDEYYVPRACGQCHGTEVDDQKGAKVNYLDTDHWIDRTGDDFNKVPASNVIVDGAPSYTVFRQLNGEIEEQNEAVIKQSGGSQFALLAVRKWLDLHKEDQPDANQHISPLRRGFAEKAGDAVWTQGASPDTELLPVLNQYCFRCHSSARYHVFQKQTVLSLRARIRAKVKSGSMPQDRELEQSQIDRIVALVDQLK